MKVQTEELTKGVKAANSTLDTMAKKLESVESSFKGAVVAVGGFVVTKSLISATQSASNFADEMGRAEETFGGASKLIVAEAERMNTAFGTNRTEFVKSASDIGQAFDNIGYSARDSAKLAVHYTKLAQDAAARYGGSAADAMTKIKSAVSGGADAMKEWGVDLSEANLRLKAQAMGMEGLMDKLTPAQASMARIALIEEKMAGTQGALAKSGGAVSTSIEALSGRFQKLMDLIGTSFLPIVSGALSELQVGVQVLTDVWHDMTDGVVSDQTDIADSIDDAGKKMGWLQWTVGKVADAIQLIKIGFMGAQSVVTMVIAGWVRAIAMLGDAIGQVVSKLTGLPPAANVLMKWADEMDRTIAQQHKDIAKEWAKPWASSVVDTAFDKARDRIRQERKLATAPGPDVTRLRPKEGPTPTVAPKFASMAAYGSQAAANMILQSRYGAGGGKDAAGKTADNTGKLVNQAMIQTGLFSKLVAKLSPVKPTEFDDPLARAMQGGF